MTLADVLGSHAADSKVPERAHFVPVLPKGATGKVHLNALKDALLGALPR